MDLSNKRPEMLYQFMDTFSPLLNSQYRILTWNAINILANLTRIDKDKKFDTIIDEYYRLLDDPYMITVANVVGCSGQIAKAKPHLIPRIIEELLRVDTLATTPHLTDECKREIAQQALHSFDQFFSLIDCKPKVIAFAEKHRHSPRKKLQTMTKTYLKKWT